MDVFMCVQVILVELDCSTSRGICIEEGVGTYPTLKIYRDKTDYPWEHEKDKRAFIGVCVWVCV